MVIHKGVAAGGRLDFFWTLLLCTMVVIISRAREWRGL